MKTLVLATSSSCLPSLNISHNIQTIPMRVRINEVDFLDGKNIDTAYLSQIMKKWQKSLAKTSPPTQSDMLQTFYELDKQGFERVFVCTLSSKFSETYNIIKSAAQNFTGKMQIHVFDTLSLNLIEGAMAYEADYMLRRGASLDDVQSRLRYIRQHSGFYFTLSDLSYITAAKKLSAPASFFANLFDIKPIMQIDQDGYITASDKVRKIEPTLRKMVDKTLELIGNHNAFIYLTDGGQDHLTSYFANLLSKEYGLNNLPVLPVSTTSLANHGYKGVGIGVFYGELPVITNYLH